MDALLVTYLTVTAVLVITPGSTTAVIVRNTLAGGRRAGFAAAVGAAVGNASHATAAGLGLAVVFARWPAAMTALRLGGGVYLAWLGIKSLARATSHREGDQRMASARDSGESAGRPGHGVSFREGLLVNLLNPAIAVFYLVVVPSFTPAGASRRYAAALAAVHVLMALTCHSAWAIGLHRVRQVLAGPRARRWLDAGTGAALLGLAVQSYWAR